MPARLRTLSLVLAMTAVVGTTSFPTSLVARPAQGSHQDDPYAWTADELDVGMCLPAPGTLLS
jgi:hypothetical protein